MLAVQLEVEMQTKDDVTEEQYRIDFEELYFLAISKYDKLFKQQQDTFEQIDQNNESQKQIISQADENDGAK